MQLAIIGASGFVGAHLLTEALERGHRVIAIVRNPEKISKQHPNLLIKQADVFQEAELSSLLEGCEMVLSAYNAGWQNPNLYNDFIAGSTAIQSACKKAGVKRLLVVGGAGSLEIAPGLQLVDTPQFPAEWKSGALAARDYLNTLRQEKDLNWTFLSPAIQMHPGTSGLRTGRYRIGKDQPVRDEQGESKIAVEDLAVALLDEVEKGQFIQQRFTVAY